MRDHVRGASLPSHSAPAIVGFIPTEPLVWGHGLKRLFSSLLLEIVKIFLSHINASKSK